MNTQLSKHQAKVKRIKTNMDKIEKKYPDFDFKNRDLKHDLTKYWKYQNDLIGSELDTDLCKSDNPNEMCSTCNCWKRTRNNCS